MKSKQILKSLALIASLACAGKAQAGIHTWTGSIDANWSVNGNWIESAPFVGESNITLRFTPTASRFGTVDDIPGLVIDQLQIYGTGYLLQGPPSGAPNRGKVSLTFRNPALISIFHNGAFNRIDISLPLVVTGTGNARHIFTVGTGTTLKIDSAISGPGGFGKLGGGTLILAGTSDNTFQEQVEVAGGILQLQKTDSALAIPSPLIISSTNISNASGEVRLAADEQIGNSTPVTIHPKGILNCANFIETIGTLTMDGGEAFADISGSVGFNGVLVLNGDVIIPRDIAGLPVPRLAGRVSLGGKDHVIRVGLPASGFPDFDMDALIVTGGGSGGLTIDGTGFGFTDFSRDSLQLGPTHVVKGNVRMDGTRTNSAVILEAGTSLQGRGKFGPVTLNGGTLLPTTLNTGSNGDAMVTKNLALNGASKLTVTLRGILDREFDRVGVNGSVTISPQTQLDVTLNFTPFVGTSFRIINNDGTDPIQGAFAGLPEGAIFSQKGEKFKVLYKGGTGNDVVLLYQGKDATASITGNTGRSGPRLSGLARVTDGLIKLGGVEGEPGSAYHIEANDDLSPANWYPIGSGVFAPDGAMEWTSTNQTGSSNLFFCLLKD